MCATLENTIIISTWLTCIFLAVSWKYRNISEIKYGTKGISMRATLGNTVMELQIAVRLVDYKLLELCQTK